MVIYCQLSKYQISGPFFETGSRDVTEIDIERKHHLKQSLHTIHAFHRDLTSRIKDLEKGVAGKTQCNVQHSFLKSTHSQHNMLERSTLGNVSHYLKEESGLTGNIIDNIIYVRE
jgi:hypothetical protein